MKRPLIAWIRTWTNTWTMSWRRHAQNFQTPCDFHPGQQLWNSATVAFGGCPNWKESVTPKSPAKITRSPLKPNWPWMNWRWFAFYTCIRLNILLFLLGKVITIERITLDARFYEPFFPEHSGFYELDFYCLYCIIYVFIHSRRYNVIFLSHTNHVNSLFLRTQFRYLCMFPEFNIRDK